MTDITYQRLDGTPSSLSATDVAALAAGVRGGVLTPWDAGYDAARTIWNATVDRHPALIARCLGGADVEHAINFARERGMLPSVKGGGHNIAGKAVRDGGLLIDNSAMRGVRVDPVTRRARVGAGALLADVDHETQSFGLATPLGINSTTGVAGLTLGGGFGWLTRKHGMTIDNLVSADIVTADGRRRVVSEGEEPDLFWAIRGGGGNFGVVTSFEFALHPVGPEVHSGLVVYPLEQARVVLRAWRAFARAAAEETSVWVVLRRAPPLPFLPESIHGQPIVALAAMHCGGLAEGERVLAPLLDFGEPAGNALMPHPYAGFQQAFDPLLAPGARNYWKSHDFADIDDALIDQLLDAVESLPGPECELFIAHLGGAMGRVPMTETAFGGRDAAYVMNVHARWQDPADDDACIGWARETFERAAPFATGSVYVNFLTEDEEDRVGAAYGVNHARLQEVKRLYDPDNLFRANMNVAPGAQVATA